MNLTRQQNLTEAVADFVWVSLEDLFKVSRKSRPPVYYFLSPRSRGSLTNRQPEEIDLVHRQQQIDEGITLIAPPVAYVSRAHQTYEEAAHLFALTHQPSTLRMIHNTRRKLSRQTQINAMILHEAFGAFAHCLLSTPSRSRLSSRRPRRPRQLSKEEIWSFGHHDGYILGQKLAQRFIEESVTQQDLVLWFRARWYSTEKKPAALRWLEAL